MKKYLRQLHNDIKQAHCPEQGPPDLPPPPATIEEELEQSERLVLTDPPYTFGDHCGLRREQFPPAERLTAAQLAQLMEALKEMMWTYSVSVTLPDSLPPEQRYHWMLCALDEKIHLDWGGMVGISFCEEDPDEGCIFGTEHCTCRRLEDDWEHNRLTSEWHERVEALILEIRQAIAAMPETLEFQSAVTEAAEEVQGGGLVYKPMAEWLELDLGRFPHPDELTSVELSALAKKLLTVFDEDDEMAHVIRLLDDAERKYTAALGYWEIPVHHDGMGNYHFKPISPEEQSAWFSNIKSPLDSLDLGNESPPPPKVGEEDDLPW